MTGPAISVILPVRNGGDYLPLALSSILNQAEVDLEVIVVDDGSDDGTDIYLATVRDDRLRVVQRAGEGLVDALNAGLAAARGKYIARMDADDLALPGRLHTQAELLDTRNDIDLAFSSAYLINAQGHRSGFLPAEFLTRDQRIAVLLGERRGFPIVHPTVMMRRSMIEVLGGYRQSPSAEDHELWLRAIERFRFGAIPQPLLEYRHHTGGTSRVRAVEQSLSNLMNATCYRIRLQTGVDFQADAPAEYEELRTWASGEFGENLTLIARARQIRSEARRGDKANAIRALVRFPLKHLGFLSQANVRRWMLRAQGRMQRQSIRLLAAKTSRPRGE